MATGLRTNRLSGLLRGAAVARVWEGFRCSCSPDDNTDPITASLLVTDVLVGWLSNVKSCRQKIRECKFDMSEAIVGRVIYLAAAVIAVCPQGPQLLPTVHEEFGPRKTTVGPL